MKKYTTDMAKLIVLLIVTPMLVMAYTTIEKNISVSPANHSTAVFTGATPVSIGLMDKSNSSTHAINKAEDKEYLLVRYNWPLTSPGMNEKGGFQSGFTTSRFTLLLL